MEAIVPKSKVTNVQVQGKQKGAQSAAAPGRRNQPNTTVRLGKAEETIPVTDLMNSESLSIWQQRLQPYQGKPFFRIRNLETLKDETRFNLFSLIASQASHTVAIGPGRDPTDLNLFGAVLGAINGELIVSGETPRQRERAIARADRRAKDLGV
jgi:hypothetical protein